MSESLIGICSKHADRDGLWVADKIYLCTECAAKEIVVLNGVVHDTATGKPFKGDPLRPMRQVIGKLVHGHLTHLWSASPAALPDDPTDEQREDHLGCCPECCAPCNGLRDLAKAGWLESRQRVDPEWLWAAWGQTDKLGCHHA